MEKTIVGICSNETGELIAELTFNSWRITSKMLKALEKFCGDEYYVCDVRFIYTED